MRAQELVAGRYRLEDRIAGGGMGEVWRGFDTRLNRDVAIKLLHANLSGNATFRARFQNEAQAVAKLQAPGIVGLYDYGEENAPEGVVSYLVMELVRGKSLADIIAERGRLGPADTLRIIATAASGLHAAHRAGIIHRDVKPANMLVDGEGNVKLVDFGIARAKGDAGMTETGMVMGTVAYTSPEQLCGHELTPASDVYSLGVVAYECLSGRPPFSAENPGTAINGHLNQTPPPLPQDVPQPVVDVVFKALAKNPENRWATAQDFARACRDVAAGNAPTALMSAAGATTRVMSPTQPTARIASPPPRRPIPPEREPYDEPPEKQGGMKWLVVLTVVVLIAAVTIALVVLKPWQPGTNLGDDNSTHATQAKSSKEDSSSSEEETDTQDDTTSDAQSSEQHSSAPETVLMPDEKNAMIADALADLDSKGFTNVVPQPSQSGAGTACAVFEQTPQAGAEVSADTEIDLSYIDDGNCGV
ncbi:MAG TPA: serine/threonine-protein kinase [Stackebrandtia sp.]|uniref:serine/threonine-protein kinase n=1 Tax=Stackebrandtia sp. TaxID=2023065 RepID=UPI002D56F00C|nr:serine/threonine-protein kinase [Stackebrandtia sp.]HZE40255.1 serine/threonine-protein kinase [Stackebrandtia sp.]